MVGVARASPAGSKKTCGLSSWSVSSCAVAVVVHSYSAAAARITTAVTTEVTMEVTTE